jgi:chromosome segregation ATPase
VKTTNVTLDVLKGIQSTLSEMRTDLRDVRNGVTALESHARTTNERLAALEHHAIATKEAIDVLTTRATMTGKALTAQLEARLRLDERVDRLEPRMDAVERREH